MKKVTRIVTSKRYHLESDGSLTYLGTYSYRFTETVAPENRTRVFAMTEQMLAAANAKRRAEEEAFERLVDAAQEV